MLILACADRTPSACSKACHLDQSQYTGTKLIFIAYIYPYRSLCLLSSSFVSVYSTALEDIKRGQLITKFSFPGKWLWSGPLCYITRVSTWSGLNFTALIVTDPSLQYWQLISSQTQSFFVRSIPFPRGTRNWRRGRRINASQCSFDPPHLVSLVLGYSVMAPNSWISRVDLWDKLGCLPLAILLPDHGLDAKHIFCLTLCL